MTDNNPAPLPAVVRKAAEWLEEKTDTPAGIQRVTSTHIRLVHQGERLRLEANYRRTPGRRAGGRWVRAGSPLFQDGERRENVADWREYTRLFNEIENGESGKLHLPEVIPADRDHVPGPVAVVHRAVRAQLKKNGKKASVVVGHTPGREDRYTVAATSPNGVKVHYNLTREGNVYGPDPEGYLMIADADGNDLTAQAVENAGNIMALFDTAPTTPFTAGEPRSAPGRSNSVTERRHSVIRV